MIASHIGDVCLQHARCIILSVCTPHNRHAAPVVSLYYARKLLCEGVCETSTLESGLSCGVFSRAADTAPISDMRRHFIIASSARTRSKARRKARGSSAVRDARLDQPAPPELWAALPRARDETLRSPRLCDRSCAPSPGYRPRARARRHGLLQPVAPRDARAAARGFEGERARAEAGILGGEGALARLCRLPAPHGGRLRRLEQPS